MAEINYVFQTDSSIIEETYKNNPNYLIEYDKSQNESTCVLYFSSHDIYYPNNEAAFTSQLIRKDRYEWYKQRVTRGTKHIFLRDIKKQWYLTGINSELNSVEKLLAFLQKETHGHRIITLGSSAGGFAAVLFGSMLNAETILTFNGQFMLHDLLESSGESINPVLFREKDNPLINKYFSLKSFIREPNKVFYFYSESSRWDSENFRHVEKTDICAIPFQTGHHGIPFLKSNLKYVINMPNHRMEKMAGKSQHPLVFSLKVEGILGTAKSIFSQSFKIIQRKLNF